MNRNSNATSTQATSIKNKGLEVDFQKVKNIQCDLSDSKLGFDDDLYHYCLQLITHVVHTAWDVNLNRPLEAFNVPHVSGVRYLIDFCVKSVPNAHLLFISTMSSSLGESMDLTETVPEKVPHAWSSAQPMGYAQSKLVAERLINTAARVSGLRSTIYRVGQISGPTTQHGCWKTTEWLPSLIASSVHLQKLPASLGSLDQIDWIPVNFVARILVELLLKSPGATSNHNDRQHAPSTGTTSAAESDSRGANGYDYQGLLTKESTKHLVQAASDNIAVRSRF